MDQLQNDQEPLAQPSIKTLRHDYIDYIQKSYSRISERQQHTGVTRWALLGGLAYIAWQSVPMLVKVKGVSSGWQGLCLTSALFLVISCFGFHLYQSLNATNRPSPYDFRQLGATASAKTSLLILIILVSYGPVILLSYLAWETVPNLSTLTYRFLSLTAWFLSITSVLLCGFILYNDRYIKTNGFMPPVFLNIQNKGNAYSTAGTIFHLFFIGSSIYLVAININKIPPDILEQVLLLSGSIALIPPCIEAILSSVHTQDRLNLLSVLERDILMHNLPEEEIKARLENDLIGSELGDWARRRVEKVRRVHNEIMKYCEEVEITLLEVSELDASLKFERKGRVEQCITELDKLITELTECWEPLNSWLDGCRTQTFRDPYITKVVERTLDDLSPLMKSAVQAARSSLKRLKQHPEEN